MDILESIINFGITNPDETAICHKNQNITYGTLIRQMNAVSKEIIELKKSIGSKQTPVVILGERGIEFIVSILGVLQSGNYYIPLEMPHMQTRFDQINQQLDNYIVISLHDYDFLSKYELKYLIKYIDINFNCDNTQYWKKLAPDELCYVIYTSGTKSVPKGAMIRYESLCNLVSNFLKNIYSKFDSKVSVGVLSSFSFDASIKQIFGALCHGHNLVISQNEDKLFSLRMQRLFEKHNIRVIDGTPSIYKLLMKKPKTGNWRIQTFLIGGELLKQDFIDSFMNFLNYECEIINVYGPTECCVDASYFVVNTSEKTYDNIVPIGNPIPNAHFHIHNETGELITSDNVAGELYISGVLVGDGYLMNPNSKSFYNCHTYGRTYRTGDLAIRTSSGEYVVLGRIDDQVKYNGNRLELSEVEEVISDIVKQDTVVCITKENDFDVLYAFIFEEESHTNIPETIVINECRKTLPNYCIPRKVMYIGKDTPITNNGKIDRNNLINKYLKKE